MTRPEVRAFHLPPHRGSRSSLIQVERSVWNGLVNGPRMRQSKIWLPFWYISSMSGKNKHLTDLLILTGDAL